MLILYSVPESLYCAKLRILLRHKGLVWSERTPPGGYTSDAYKAIVPTGSIPAIVDGALTLADSEAIAEYLNERHPAPPMLPEDLAARALVRQLSRFHDTRLEPALRLLFPLMRPAQRDAAKLAAAREQITLRLGQLEHVARRAPGAASGQPLTLGDCGYPITFRWIERLSAALGAPIALPDAAQAYDAALLRQEAVAAELKDYTASMDAWIDRVSTPT